MPKEWWTYKGETLLGSVTLVIIVDILMFTIGALMFAIPMDRISDDLIKLLGFLMTVNALFFLLIGIVVRVMEKIAFRRFGLSIKDFEAAILPVLEWNNIHYQLFERMVATPVVPRMKEDSVIHYSLNGGEEDMYIGYVGMSREVALGPYEGEHVKVIDQLAREIDMTLGNL